MLVLCLLLANAVVAFVLLNTVIINVADFACVFVHKRIGNFISLGVTNHNRSRAIKRIRNGRRRYTH